MKRPYIAALNLPFALLGLPFMKKETVIGTIGNTQGVRSIARPQRIASSMSAQRFPLDEDWEAGERVNSKSQSSGIRHWSPVQELQPTVPEILTFPTALIFCFIL